MVQHRLSRRSRGGSVGRPGVEAIAVDLGTQQHLPWGCTCEVLADLLGGHRSEGTLARLIERTARGLVPVEEHITGAHSQGGCDPSGRTRTGWETPARMDACHLHPQADA